MIKIGDKEVVYQASLIVPDGQIASLNVQIGNWKFTAMIEFLPHEGDKPSIQLKGDQDKVHIIFKHWNHPHTCTKVPINLGTLSDGTPFDFLAFNIHIVDTNRLDLHILRGGIYNE